MFELVKTKVNLLELLEKDLQVSFKECGGENFSIEDERDHGGCPFCHHNDCFKVKHQPDDLKESFYKCFSCDAIGSVIDWTAERHSLSIRDAALKLAKDYDIPIPKDYNPIQEVFEVASGYYANCFWDICNKPQIKLAKMAPSEYQLKVRRHKQETLETFQVGWSDGGLVEFLESLGFDPEILLNSGLKNKKTGRDYLPNDCFIYPHKVKGRTSHFTFKDPLKKLAYQLPNKYVLNGYEFYNQDCLKDFETVIVVEGENDLLSVFENTTKYGVIATIGNLSGGQLDWMRENLGTKHVITMFDPDDAGDKYREKVNKIRASFLSLTQIRPPNEKDVDDLLTSGTSLDHLLADKSYQAKVETQFTPPKELSTTIKVTSTNEEGQDVEAEETISNNSVVEKWACYWKVKFKDGEPSYTKISNFTIKLKNVYVTEDGDRLREIIVVREDGFTSDPIHANSETKVSLKAFRTLLARSADADFRGTESDLIYMWDLVYSKGSENLVKVTRVAGRQDRNKGWLFQNKFISDSGEAVDPDDSGIFWVGVGIRAESLNKTGSNDIADIPRLDADKTVEESEEILKGLAQNLAKNLGDPGNALLMLGWMNACAYSNSIFSLNRSFPMLFVWGSNGEGKGTICNWLLSLYDMAERGKTTVSQLKSGVGFGRKAEYYASLPLLVDEIRADLETKLYESTFRSYYDRDARTMGAKDGFGVIVKDVRSCFMFAGEDHFEDPATKERCITVRIPKLGREKVESYHWIDAHKSELSSIGYKWVTESVGEDHKALLTEIKKLDKELILEARCSSRKSKNWAVVGLFAMRMAERFFPDFDMRKYLYDASTKDSEAQKSETTVAQFFETVESIRSQEGIPKLTNAHIMCEGDHLHIWFPHVYRVVQEAYHGKFAFTKNAIMASLREEPYFVSDVKKISMGMSGVRRVVITLDLTKAPDSIKNIGHME
jgi:5S rRNA maturation endonuclease (ribonuclease M5)